MEVILSMAKISSIGEEEKTLTQIKCKKRNKKIKCVDSNKNIAIIADSVSKRNFDEVLESSTQECNNCGKKNKRKRHKKHRDRTSSVSGKQKLKQSNEVVSTHEKSSCPSSDSEIKQFYDRERNSGNDNNGVHSTKSGNQKKDKKTVNCREKPDSEHSSSLNEKCISSESYKKKKKKRKTVHETDVRRKLEHEINVSEHFTTNSTDVQSEKIDSESVKDRSLKKHVTPKPIKSTKWQNKPKLKSSKKEIFPYGNYNRYYGYRNPDKEDYRFSVLRTEWFKGKDVLDVGCNTGQFTLLVAKEKNPKKIIGIDIDAQLIKIAQKNVRHYVSSKGSTFPVSFMMSYGTVGAPYQAVDMLTFPNNVVFVKV